MRIVAALGGNALLQRGEPPDALTQEHHIRSAVAALAPIAGEHQLVLTHGNGPQVGLLALESAADASLSQPYPIDALGAQTQGLIGYWLQQAFQNALPGRDIACVITQTLVSSADPAFSNPSKFVGPVYSEADAARLAERGGWVIKADGQYWRRVVASPTPQRMIETRLIRRLVDEGTLVICGGGGGVPVIRNHLGELQGIEAVIDKDATADLIAEAVDADVLLLLTDVGSVMLDFGTPHSRPLDRATPTYLRTLPLPAGSMGPKVEAACRFVEFTGRTAAIGALTEAHAILAGKAGTVITPSGSYG